VYLSNLLGADPRGAGRIKAAVGHALIATSASSVMP
jgi:hypothetical protein